MGLSRSWPFPSQEDYQAHETFYVSFYCVCGGGQTHVLLELVQHKHIALKIHWDDATGSESGRATLNSNDSHTINLTIILVTIISIGHPRFWCCGYPGQE